MFSSIKIEELMESEFSVIFHVKLVAKNILLGYPGTHFMHMRVKINFKDRKTDFYCHIQSAISNNQ